MTEGVGVTILVIEDEMLIRELVEVALTEGGFVVEAASDGADALRRIEADPTRFRALVTDIRLGSRPDGWHIAERARELVPHMPVVYMSGDSAPDWHSKGVPHSVMVSKPFAPAQIVTAVASVINSEGATG